MKNIRAIPKYIFDDNFTNDSISNNMSTCFISILDEDNSEVRYDLNMDNFICIRIWDIEEDIYKDGELIYESPKDSELIKIVNFIERHSSKVNFIIHCSAGISRSGAVAEYIRYKFIDEVDKSSFYRYNRNIQPNLYILNRLKKLDVNIK